MNRIHAALALVVVVSGCGGGESFPNPAAPSVPSTVAASVTRLRIAGNTTLTTVGETSQLTAIATFSDGAERDVTLETAWASTDPSVATVGAGLVTVRRFGATSVSARHQTSQQVRSAFVELRPTPAGTFVIVGRVREPGQGGLAGVTVTDAASLSSVVSDQFGDYFLASLPGSETRLQFSKTEYEAAEINATQTHADTELQRVIRVRIGEKVSPPGFAPNDFTYMVGGERCFPCRLVRIVADSPATVHVRVTWDSPRLPLSLWANGSITSGFDLELEADVLVPQGESIVYVGMKQGAGPAGVHMPFTIEATVK